MKEFTIVEDFPKSEIEFDLRFSNPSACYDYLFSLTASEFQSRSTFLIKK